MPLSSSRLHWHLLHLISAFPPPPPPTPLSVSSYSHINLWSSSPLLSLSPFVLLFLSPPPPPIPLSTSSSPPYLTGCHSNSVCRWLNVVYLLFLSSPLLDEHCFCIMCAWGIDERGKRWRKGNFNHRSGGPATTLIFLVFILSISLFLQVNLSPFPFFLCRTPTPIKPLHGVWPCRWAGVAGVPGSYEARGGLNNGMRWIGLATSNVSLTHGVNNAGGKKKHTLTEAEWEGQHGLQQFDVARAGLKLLFWSGYHISMPI